MKTQFHFLSRTIAALGYTVGIACLLAAMVLSVVQSPASAAGPSLAPINQEGEGGEPAACVPPDGFLGTTRLHTSGQTSRTWKFEVKDEEKYVTLRFDYFQDYDSSGCPFDCSTGRCQTDEIGEGETPFGTFEIGDGSEGANDGSIRMAGLLPPGEYEASFHVTAGGSINISMAKSMKPPKKTPTPEPPPPTEQPPTETPAEPTDTPTEPSEPTATQTEPVLPPGEPTATPTEPVLPPGEPTATPTEVIPPSPTATEAGPGATPTEPVLPPGEPTATPTEPDDDEPRPRPTRTPTPGAPATLPPPSQPTRVGQAPVIVPVTGADLTVTNATSGFSQGVFVKLGVGLLGLALVLHGFSRKIR